MLQQRGRPRPGNIEPAAPLVKRWCPRSGLPQFPRFPFQGIAIVAETLEEFTGFGGADTMAGGEAFEVMAFASDDMGALVFTAVAAIVVHGDSPAGCR